MQLTYRQDELEKAAKLVLSQSHSKILLFYGTMGVGKTTLIKEICSQLGVVEQAASPTFSIVNEYEGAHGPVYHFDLYRIDHPDEALDLGIDDYFYSGYWTMVEWPDKISELLPAEAQKVMIEKNPDESRTLRLVEK